MYTNILKHFFVRPWESNVSVKHGNPSLQSLFWLIVWLPLTEKAWVQFVALKTTFRLRHSTIWTCDFLAKRSQEFSRKKSLITSAVGTENREKVIDEELNQGWLKNPFVPHCWQKVFRNHPISETLPLDLKERILRFFTPKTFKKTHILVRTLAVNHLNRR